MVNATCRQDCRDQLHHNPSQRESFVRHRHHYQHKVHPVQTAKSLQQTQKKTRSLQAYNRHQLSVNHRRCPAVRHLEVNFCHVVFSFEGVHRHLKSLNSKRSRKTRRRSLNQRFHGVDILRVDRASVGQLVYLHDNGLRRCTGISLQRDVFQREGQPTSSGVSSIWIRMCLCAPLLGTPAYCEV